MHHHPELLKKIKDIHIYTRLMGFLTMVMMVCLPVWLFLAAEFCEINTGFASQIIGCSASWVMPSVLQMGSALAAFRIIILLQGVGSIRQEELLHLEIGPPQKHHVYDVAKRWKIGLHVLNKKERKIVANSMALSWITLGWNLILVVAGLEASIDWVSLSIILSWVLAWITKKVMEKA